MTLPSEAAVQAAIDYDADHTNDRTFRVHVRAMLRAAYAVDFSPEMLARVDEAGA